MKNVKFEINQEKKKCKNTIFFKYNNNNNKNNLVQKTSIIHKNKMTPFKQ